MPQFRVISKSTREIIGVDKIKPREHNHISGATFTDSMLASIVEQYGSSAVDGFSGQISKPDEVKVESTEETTEKKEHWKVRQKREREEEEAKGNV